MNIYKLYADSDKGKHPYVLSEEHGTHLATLFDSPLPTDWHPPKFSIHRRSGKLADAISWQTQSPLLSARAVQLFSQSAPNCAEYRPFAEIKGKPYFVMNVLAIEPSSILDEERSTFGHAGQVYCYVFKADKQRGLPPMFRVTSGGYPNPEILVTEAIPRMVVAECLTGFEFRDPNNPRETKDLYLGKDLNIYPGVLP